MINFGIQGVTSNSDGIRYAIKYNDMSAVDLVCEKDAFDKWPLEVIDYLQSRIDFQMPMQPVQVSNAIEFNITAAIGEPAEILGKFKWFSFLVQYVFSFVWF